MPLPRYPSDLTDEEWEILEPLLSTTEKRGRPHRWPSCRDADAVFYLLRSGCSWRKSRLDQGGQHRVYENPYQDYPPDKPEHRQNP